MYEKFDTEKKRFNKCAMMKSKRRKRSPSLRIAFEDHFVHLNMCTTMCRLVVFVVILFSLLHLGHCQGRISFNGFGWEAASPLGFSAGVCHNVHCGSGFCITTQNPSLPYFCRCPSGVNTILPCPMESQWNGEEGAILRSRPFLFPFLD